MPNILDKYGIKEVCDVTFYAVDNNGHPTHPVLFLDTLKVSSVEQTASTAEARGGKGNPILISWDFGKEVNVNITDALFSAKSLGMIYGSKAVDTGFSAVDGNGGSQANFLMKTDELIATATVDSAAASMTAAFGAWNSKIGNKTKTNIQIFNANGSAVTSVSKDQRYFVTYNYEVDNATIIEISANTFPGTYYVTGDTFARNAASGQDECFQLIFPKAKMNSEVTLTLEAEGDPTVFDMSLKLMRPANGVMMQLIKYSVGNSATTATPQVKVIGNPT